MSLAVDTRGIVEALRPRRDAVRRRLAAVRRRVRARLLLSGLAWTWGALFAFAVLSLAADWLLRLSLPVRLSLAGAAGAVFVGVVWRRLISPLGVRLNDLDLAALLDRRCPGVGQRVASVLQLPKLIEERVWASPGMVQAAVLEHAQALESADLRSAFNHKAHRRMLLFIAVTGMAAAGFAYRFPQTTALWARRWFTGSNERWPQKTYLILSGLGDAGRLLVPRGESLLIEVDAQPHFTGQPGVWKLAGRGETLSVRSMERPGTTVPESVAIAYRPGDGPVKQGNFTHYSDALFRYEIPAVSEPLDFSITGGDDWFGPIRLEPIDRPGVKSIRIQARRPGRDEVETHTAEGADAQLLFVPDTELTLDLTADVPLAAANLSAKEGTAPTLKRLDATRYTTQWVMKEAQTFQIGLVSEEGGLTSKPYYLSIGLLIDREPRVSIRSSGVGRRVTPQARIPLALHAADDFGLATLALEMERAVPKEEKPETKTEHIGLDLPAGASSGALSTDVDLQTTLSLSERLLEPGTLLKLRAQATDDRAQGAQTGSSRWLTFQIVTPEELFYEILMRQRAERAKFGSALESAKAQSETLATVPSADAAFALVRKHQVIARQVWQVANRLEVTLTEMELNDLGSSQARELLRTKVIDAIRQMHAEPMTRLRVALDSVAADPSANDPLSEARELAQEVVDQMGKILEQMAQWENFVDVLNQLKAIVKLQSGVLEATEEEKKKRTQELFDD
ncbi:MAG TPA: hypothetical protein VG826_27650 [Pirellulales bacterium]|nr:hypothetical protein [Pirellulales bacterium]